MKKKIKITSTRQLNKQDKRALDQRSNKSDFYDRWYAKFGKPETKTMPADEFLQMLKEVIDFE